MLGQLVRLWDKVRHSLGVPRTACPSRRHAADPLLPAAGRSGLDGGASSTAPPSSRSGLDGGAANGRLR